MKTIRFRREALRPGLIVHTRNLSRLPSFGRIIRFMLTKGLRQSDSGGAAVWGNHDALVVRAKVLGGLGIGDAQPWRCRVTTLDDYEAAMNSRKLGVRVFQTIQGNDDIEKTAAAWWTETVNGTFYDFRAYTYLCVKALFMGYVEAARGWEWAFWCTEGASKAYVFGQPRGGASWTGRDGFERQAPLLGIWGTHGPWLCESPTPLTTERRAGMYEPETDKITLEEVTESVIDNAPRWEYVDNDWAPVFK